MQKYLSYCNWEPKDFTEKKISTKIVIFLEGMQQEKCSAAKKKNPKTIENHLWKIFNKLIKDLIPAKEL